MDRKLGGLILLVLAGATSGQESMQVMGLTMGQPFSLPECPTTGNKRYLMYQSVYLMTAKPCWMHDTMGPKPNQPISGSGEEIVIAMSSDNVPRGVDWKEITGVVVGGRLESITALTTGADSQDELFQQLKAKYGEPTSLESIPLQNRMGASFKSTMARWEKGPVHVSFTGMAYRTTTGMIKFSTQAGLAYQKAATAAEEAQKPKF